MLLKDVMTHNVEVTSPDETIEQAARRMKELDVGPLPVCEGIRVVGMLTDRDITVRSTAAGCNPKTTLVRDAMSPDVISCFEDQDVRVAMDLMDEKHIQRLLILSRANSLVGIASRGDLVAEAARRLLAQILAQGRANDLVRDGMGWSQPALA